MTNKIIPHSPTSVDYQENAPSDKNLIEEVANPFEIFTAWFKDAKEHEINDPNAMCISSVDESGMPDARMVLLKDYDERGFVFYTNFESAKGREILSNHKAAICIHWKSLHRQVRVRGIVEVVDDKEADEYFAQRAKTSQIGAWASKQSQTMENLGVLLKRVAEYGVKFNIGKVPRPKYWSGLRIVPLQMEFWRDRAFRLHERLEYSRIDPSAPWVTRRKFP